MNASSLGTRDVEAKGVEWALNELFPLWQKPGTQVIDTRDCRSRELMQRTLGDFILTTSTDEVLTVEVKAERRHTGNLFLESWSNFTADNSYRRDGWLFTLRADVYLNVFLDTEVAYVLPLPDLRRWALEDGNAFTFPERPVGMSVAGEQRNMTLGFVVPVVALLAERGKSKPVRVAKYARSLGRWTRAPLAKAA